MPPPLYAPVSPSWSNVNEASGLTESHVIGHDRTAEQETTLNTHTVESGSLVLWGVEGTGRCSAFPLDNSFGLYLWLTQKLKRI